MSKLKVFSMVRQQDASGVSGVGRVLDGIVWHNGKVTVCWRTDPNSSITIYDSFEIFKAIHIDSHPDNGTLLAWGSIFEDGPLERTGPKKPTYKEQIQALLDSGKCPFDLPYRGFCGKSVLAYVDNDGWDVVHDYCAGHLKVKCKCGRQAVKECPVAGPFTCCAPLCENCSCRSH